ncbi:MAG: hypothetical protein HDP34_05350 [Clostridia bacterium]|nr:hypothetical protein [Clostridia bacterium]
MKKSYLKYIALSLALVTFGAAIIIFPERYVNCSFQGFAMWAECVLPSLFPFMIITLIFVKTGMAEKASLPLKKVTGIFNLPPAAAPVFVLSVFSGYPAGSRVLSEFYENGSLTKTDCKKLSYLASTSGPLFIVGSVGFKMFQDKLAGIKILIAHVFAVTVISLIIALFSKKSEPAAKPRRIPDDNVLYNTFYGAVISVTVAGGFIAFFYVVATFFADFNLLYPLQKLLSLFVDEKTASALCLGLIEATTGCRALAQISGGKLQIASAGFLITFGGVSILLQQLSYLIKAGVSPVRFIAAKLLQAALCFAILLLIA